SGASAEQGPLTFRATQPHRSGSIGGTAQGLLFIIGFLSFVFRRWPQQPRQYRMQLSSRPVDKRTIPSTTENEDGVDQWRRHGLPSASGDLNTRLLTRRNWQFLQPLLII